MTTQTDSNQTNTESESTSHGEESLQWLRGALRDRVDYIEDPELKQRTISWIQASFNIPAGDIDQHIEARLAELEAEYKMYAHDGVEEGTDAFPDQCEGCPHYGGGCPIVTQSVPQDKLTQIADEADTQAEFKRGIRNLARRYECHRIPEWVAEWNTRYESTIVEGWDIYHALGIDIGETDASEIEPKLDLQGDTEDGGTY